MTSNKTKSLITSYYDFGYCFLFSSQRVWEILLWECPTARVKKTLFVRQKRLLNIRILAGERILGWNLLPRQIVTIGGTLNIKSKLKIHLTFYDGKLAFSFVRWQICEGWLRKRILGSQLCFLGRRWAWRLHAMFSWASYTKDFGTPVEKTAKSRFLSKRAKVIRSSMSRGFVQQKL